MMQRWCKARMAFNNRRCRRAGTTLVELIVVIALVTFLLSATAISLFSLYQIDSRVRDNLDLLTSDSNFSVQLRQDAHAARRAKVVGAESEADQVKASELTLEFSQDKQIVYATKGPRVERLVKRNGKVVHRDSFAMAEGTTVTWKVASVAGKSILELNSRAASSDESELKADMASRIQCAIGSDFRFSEDEVEATK